MSWPTDGVRILDEARYQGHELDWWKIAEKNSDVKVIVPRCGVGDYYTDPEFDNNFDDGGSAGFHTGAYYVINPSSDFKKSSERLKSSLDGRKPRLLVADCEKAPAWTLPSKATIIDYTRRYLDFMSTEHPQAEIWIYTADWYWSTYLGYLDWAKKFPLFVAHYLFENYTARTQYEGFDKFEARLPIDNDNVPYLPLGWRGEAQASAWQFSSFGVVDGIAGADKKPRTDLGLMTAAAFNRLFTQDAQEPADQAIDVTDELAQIRSSADSIETKVGG